MAQTDSPADVLPLLQAMVGHRQRVVRQIAGVPLAAQAALSAASSFDSKASKETWMSTTPRAGEGLILEAHKENHHSLFPEGFSALPRLVLT